jgi:hypothetical protein
LLLMFCAERSGRDSPLRSGALAPSDAYPSTIANLMNTAVYRRGRVLADRVW